MSRPKNDEYNPCARCFERRDGCKGYCKNYLDAVKKEKDKQKEKEKCTNTHYTTKETTQS